jgi:hypothetical protein
MSRARAGLSRRRLSSREIWVLLHLLDRCGVTGRTTLPPKRRDGVPPLWRQHLVEIWYRCAPDEGVAHGPYFNLTTDGFQIACALRAGRDEYRKSHPEQFTRPPRRAARPAERTQW